MRVSSAAGVATLILSLGCVGLEGVFAPPGGGIEVLQPAPEEPEPAPAPAPAPALQAPTSTPFEGISGWVGQGVQPGQGWWVPAEGGAAVSWDADAWSGVGLGATFSGLSAAGPVELSFTGVRSIPLCGTPTPAATFSAPRALSGVIWITRDPSAMRASLPRQARAATATRRLYSLPSGAEVDISRTGGVGRTVVEWGGARPWVQTFGGAGVDLRRPDAPGPMWPELVLLDDDSLSILFRVHEAGSLGWEWVRIEGRRGISLGRTSLAVAGCG